MGAVSFVVLEGLNGVGKTSIGRALAGRIHNGIYIATPPAVFRSIREGVDQSACLMSHFLFYLAAVCESAVEIRRLLDGGAKVICDRYVGSTVASHRALGLDVSVPDFIDLPKPDLSFLIVCDQKVRLGRMHERGVLSINDLRERESEIEQRTLSEFGKFSMIEIDNTAEGVEPAISAILNYIGG